MSSLMILLATFAALAVLVLLESAVLALIELHDARRGELPPEPWQP